MDTNEQLSSKTIKVLRESKFTEKRNPYKKYNKAKWNWTEIFKEIDLLKNDTSKILKATSKKYNINYKTLKINILIIKIIKIYFLMKKIEEVLIKVLMKKKKKIFLYF